MPRKKATPASQPSATGSDFSNAEIAARLGSVAQLLSIQGENPFKVRAYRRAADLIRDLSESVAERVQKGDDLTSYPGIGKAMDASIKEIVVSGKLQKLEVLRAEVTPAAADLSEYPRLDPKRVQRIFAKLKISSIEALRDRLDKGEIGEVLGAELERHVRQGLSDTRELLLADADKLGPQIQTYLLEEAGARRAEPVGAYRRRVEVLDEIAFLVETENFPGVVAALQRFGGKSHCIETSTTRAVFRLPDGTTLRVDAAPATRWGIALLLATGAEGHLEQLSEQSKGLPAIVRGKGSFPREEKVYRELGLAWVPPELREGHDEVTRAAAKTLPVLIERTDIKGDLHAHSTSSDGSDSIEAMVEAAKERGYEYLGITDHSQSLKIAGGVSEETLWKQIRRIDRLNAKLRGFRILKSAEVDILADGSLDYSDDLLAALDYTVCSIHSRFAMKRVEQTERLLRAMDHPAFTILGHATGRKLLKRAGYEIDLERLITHAKARGCFFEINASPDRLDLSAQNARLVQEAGIKIAVCTDAHSIDELDFMRWGIDQARRAGLQKSDLLNTLPVGGLLKVFARARG